MAQHARRRGSGQARNASRPEAWRGWQTTRVGEEDLAPRFVRLDEAVAASTSLGPSTGTPRAAAPNRPAQRRVPPPPRARRGCHVTLRAALLHLRLRLVVCSVNVLGRSGPPGASAAVQARCSPCFICAVRVPSRSKRLAARWRGPRGLGRARHVAVDGPSGAGAGDPLAALAGTCAIAAPPSHILTWPSTRLCSLSCPRRSTTHSCRRHRPSWSPCSGTGSCSSSSSATLGGPRPACSRRWTASSCSAT